MNRRCRNYDVGAANCFDCRSDSLPDCDRWELVIYPPVPVITTPAPTWTTTPPTEPGKWFWRFVGETETHVCELDSEIEGDIFDFEDPNHPREWYSVQIEEPK